MLCPMITDFSPRWMLSASPLKMLTMDLAHGSRNELSRRTVKKSKDSDFRDMCPTLSEGRRLILVHHYSYHQINFKRGTYIVRDLKLTIQYNVYLPLDFLTKKRYGKRLSFSIQLR